MKLCVEKGECGKVYIDQISCSIETRIKGHHWPIRLYHPDKSAVGEYSTDLGHSIQFQDTRILVMKTGCTEHIIWEAGEMQTPS